MIGLIGALVFVASLVLILFLLNAQQKCCYGCGKRITRGQKAASMQDTDGMVLFHSGCDHLAQARYFSDAENVRYSRYLVMVRWGVEDYKRIFDKEKSPEQIAEKNREYLRAHNAWME